MGLEFLGNNISLRKPHLFVLQRNTCLLAVTDMVLSKRLTLLSSIKLEFSCTQTDTFTVPALPSNTISILSTKRSVAPVSRIMKHGSNQFDTHLTALIINLPANTSAIKTM